MVLVKNDINATWRAMEKLVDAGKTRNIGLSNFNCQHIRQVLSIARIRPTSLQVECHPHLSQTKLLRFVREAGIRMSGERLSMVIIICLRLISRISNTFFSCVLSFQPNGRNIIHQPWNGNRERPTIRAPSNFGDFSEVQQKLGTSAAALGRPKEYIADQ